MFNYTELCLVRAAISRLVRFVLKQALLSKEWVGKKKEKKKEKKKRIK